MSIERTGVYRCAACYGQGGDCDECDGTGEIFVIKPPKAAPDMVNHPPHYTSHPSGIECIAITQHHSFCVGNAIKYLWRAGHKGENAVEDLKKAAWYINREAERISKESEEEHGESSHSKEGY